MTSRWQVSMAALKLARRVRALFDIEIRNSHVLVVLSVTALPGNTCVCAK